MARKHRMLSGGLSRTSRRRAVTLLVVLAGICRIVPLVRLVRAPEQFSGALAESMFVRPFVGSGFDLGEFFLNPAIAWVGSPLYLLAASLDTTIGTGGGWLLIMQTMFSIVLVLSVLWVGERILGTTPALIAAFAIAICEPMIRGGMLLAPLALSIILSLGLVRRVFEIAAHRESSAAYSLGARLGLLALAQGFLALWLPLVLLWLPTRSQRFRGLSGLRFAGLCLAGFLTLQLPVILHGALINDDLTLSWENAAFDLRRASESERVEIADDGDHLNYPLGRRERGIYLHQQEHAGPKAGALERWSSDLGAAARWQPGLWWRRFTRSTGGQVAWPGEVAAVPADLLQGLPLLRAEWLLPFALLGAIALTGSIGAYGPLFLALLLPLLVAMATGVEAAMQVLLLPVQALFAGYGIARVWNGRSWLGTWILSPIILLVGWWWVGRF